MPVQFLGQLGPSRQQRLALERSLRGIPTAVGAPGGVSALSRGLGGPSYAETHQPKDVTKKTDWVAIADRRIAAQERKRVIQLESSERSRERSARMRERLAGVKEKLATEREEEETRLASEADALYGFVQDISKEDQDFILAKITEMGKPSALGAALAEPKESVTARAERYEREGKGWTPEDQALYYAELSEAKPGYDKTAPYARGAAPVGRAEPLMQIMIDKHYIRLDEKGEYSWMLPVEEKKVINVSTWTDESGWLQQTTTFEDGTTETTNLGREAKEEVTTGLTQSEQLGWARLQFDVEKAGAPYVSAAIKERGESPIAGFTMVDRPGGKTRKATEEDVAAYWQAIREGADYRRVAAEGINTSEDLRTRYQYDTEAIKNFQRNIPGMIVDGKWSDALEQALSSLLIGGK